MQQINSSDLLGRVINETYRLDAVLGEGSMGEGRASSRP